LESSWRLNLFIYGMQQSEMRLLARLNVPPDSLLNAVADTGNGARRFYHVSAPGQLPSFIIELPVLPAHPHFPWGLDVEPD